MAVKDEEATKKLQIAPKQLALQLTPSELPDVPSFWAAKTPDPPACNTMVVKDEETTKSHQKSPFWNPSEQALQLRRLYALR